MKKLFVRPALPDKIGGRPTNKLNHKYFPIGLLKMATLAQQQGDEIVFQVGNSPVDPKFEPEEIWVTSIFTYWEPHYEQCLRELKMYYPGVKIVMGGIYASLHPDRARLIGADEVKTGVMPEAEGIIPDYNLLPEPVDFAIIHSQRGCISKCSYCGTHIIEPEFNPKPARNVLDEVCQIWEKYGIRKFAFYDNNPLAHPEIKHLLKGLSEMKIGRKVIPDIEFQSGFDTRLLNQEVADLIREARVINPRVAWDDPSKSREENIERSIGYFLNSGYRSKEVMVFMLYNHDQSFDTLEYKRRKCQEWGVQISDCRYVPLNLFEDRYSPGGTNADYYIHDGWSNELIRKFRRNVRGQNILVRHIAGGRTVDEGMTKQAIPIEIIREFMKVA